MYKYKLLDPVIEVGQHELFSKMHSHRIGQEKAREEFKSIMDAGGEPVAFWIPKEQCNPPLPTDKWEILDAKNPMHLAGIQQLRHVAQSGLIQQ